MWQSCIGGYFIAYFDCATTFEALNYLMWFIDMSPTLSGS